jgi:hypothetical protein
MRRLILPMVLLAASAPMAAAQESGTATPRVRAFSWSNSDDSDRAMLGVSTGSSGKRDTLGLFVESITEGSPADKAGLEEGNRIASINGVNLKVAREDAGEPDMSGAMTNRLVREMRKLKAGDEVTLQVWSDGHYKTVKVKTVAAKDLEGPDGFSYAMRGGDAMVIAPHVREVLDRELPRVREELDRELPRVREDLDRELPRIREQIQGEIPRLREELDRELPSVMDDVRRSMDRMRIELPRMNLRVRHKVVI